MKALVIVALVFSLCSCGSTTAPKQKDDASIFNTAVDEPSSNYTSEKVVKSLEDKVESITVSYSAISCPCAQWKVERVDGEISTTEERIFLSRANTGLPNADTFWNGVTLPLRLVLAGNFYKEVGYPPGYRPAKGEPKPARVFKYSLLKVQEAE